MTIEITEFVCPWCRFPLSCNVLVCKAIKKFINIYFNFNNFPLAPQSKEISSDSNGDVWTDQHVQSGSDDSGATMHILRGLKHGRMHG